MYESTNQTFGYISENLIPLRPINREDVCALNPFFYFANVPSICDLPATALHTVLVWSLGGSNLHEHKLLDTLLQIESLKTHK